MYANDNVKSEGYEKEEKRKRKNKPVEKMTPNMTPNRNIASTSLQLVIAMITVWIPLFMPNFSSFNRSRTVTTTFGDIAVTTRLFVFVLGRNVKKELLKLWIATKRLLMKRVND